MAREDNKPTRHLHPIQNLKANTKEKHSLCMSDKAISLWLFGCDTWTSTKCLISAKWQNPEAICIITTVLVFSFWEMVAYLCIAYNKQQYNFSPEQTHEETKPWKQESPEIGKRRKYSILLVDDLGTVVTSTGALSQKLYPYSQRPEVCFHMEKVPYIGLGTNKQKHIKCGQQPCR